jgi:DNA topoisomerase I
MVVPRGAQEPVCYAEFVAMQQGVEAAPQQNGEARTGGVGKRAASRTEESGSVTPKPRKSKNAAENMPVIPNGAAGSDGAKPARVRKMPVRATASKRASGSTTASKRSAAGRSTTASKRVGVGGSTAKRSVSSRSTASKEGTGRTRAVAKPAAEKPEKAKAVSRAKKASGAAGEIKASK